MTRAHVCVWGAALLCCLIAIIDPVTLLRRRRRHTPKQPIARGDESEREGAVPARAAPSPAAALFGIEIVLDRSAVLTPDEVRSATAQYAWRNSRREPRARA